MRFRFYLTLVGAVIGRPIFLFLQVGAIHESPAVSRHVERSRKAQSKHQGVAALYKTFASLDPSADAQDDDCFYTHIVLFRFLLSSLVKITFSKLGRRFSLSVYQQVFYIKRKSDITQTSFFVLIVNQSVVKTSNMLLRLIDGFVQSQKVLPL